MKKTIIFILLIYSTTSFSQITYWTQPRDVTKKTVIGMASVEAYYNFTFHFYDVKTKKSIAYTDRRVLQLGDGLAKCRSKDADMEDSVFYKIVVVGKSDTYPSVFNKGQLSLWAEFYKNSSKGTMTVTTRFHNTDYEYQEELPKQDWIIHNETINVLNYECQKATCHFRGRDYIAWFTTEIPISSGPWKFGGLPGLVMKVSDSKDEFQFECTSLEKVATPIYYIKTDYVKTTREKLMQVDRYRHNDVAGYFKSVGVELTLGSSNPSTYQEPYNPMELE